jgi:Homeodomain-like domain
MGVAEAVHPDRSAAALSYGRRGAVQAPLSRRREAPGVRSREQWLPEPPALEELFVSEARPIATAYRRYGYTLREIGDFLGCHYATVSRALRKEEAALSERKT